MSKPAWCPPQANEVVEIGEVPMVARENAALPPDSPGQDPGVRYRHQANVVGKYNIVSCPTKPASKTAVDHVLVDQNPHARLGRSSPPHL